MSATATQAATSLRRLLRSARMRHATQHALAILPIWVGGAALLLRALPRIPATLLIASAASICVLAVFASTARIDQRWLARRIDERYRAFEDSAALLFEPGAGLPPLARLQQARLQQRVLDAAPMRLLEAWRWRPLLFALALGFSLLTAAKLLGDSRRAAASAVPAITQTPASAPTFTRLRKFRLQIQPPAYTGLAPSTQSEADARVTVGSSLHWSLRLQPAPQAASLVFHDGSALALTLAGGAWTGSRQMQRSSLYRLQIESKLPLKDDPLQRIEVIPDQPPRIQVIAPERSLSLAAPGQRRWQLVFEASDDYGLGDARLQIRHATGSGENISLNETSEALGGQGDRKTRRYARSLDLRALGFVQGDDLIVRLSVSDQRAPKAQRTLTANYILRWPDAPAAEAAGVEGLVEKVLPAYFRSQRQIIMDTEALLAERPKLGAERFAERSDLIGVDQRVLRLRYGQFLGEEADEGPGGDDDHAAEAPHQAPAAGSTASVLEQFGHTHDDAEAATLLDPETRKLLKAALNEMWQAELKLRQADPSAALPFEYRALRSIKQVQQASRIYLARVGLELPPVDPTRRLSGDASGLRNRADPARPARLPDAQTLALWQALETTERAGLATALDAAQDWARQHEAELPAALALLTAMDAVGRDPDCSDCVRELQRLLWPLLPRALAAAVLREQPDPPARAYLRALKPEEAP